MLKVYKYYKGVVNIIFLIICDCVVFLFDNIVVVKNIDRFIRGCKE